MRASEFETIDRLPSRSYTGGRYGLGYFYIDRRLDHKSLPGITGLTYSVTDNNGYYIIRVWDAAKDPLEPKRERDEAEYNYNQRLSEWQRKKVNGLLVGILTLDPAWPSGWAAWAAGL